MNQKRALRKLAAKERSGRPISVRDALACCPFRTLLSLPGASGVNPDAPKPELADAMFENVSVVLALIEQSPEPPSPIDSTTMHSILTDLANGRTVLLLSNHREIRDRARQEILAWAAPAAGSA